jgi:hypothetical protein
MAIPTDYIFTSGTCLKSELYDLIINKLIAAGWQNVSSNPTTDYDVLTSPGNTGDRALVLNLRPIPAAGTVTNTIKTSAFCQMSARLQTSYVPGTAGAAGVFGRPALAWTDVYVAPVAASGQLAADTTLNYHVYADASKIILAIEYPPATAYSPVLIYLGEPDSQFAGETGSSSVVLAVTNSATTATSLQICGTSDGMGSVTTPYALTTYALLPAGDPNMGNKRMVSNIYYGSAAESFRGMLDGVKCMLNVTVNTGDTVTIGAEVYRVLVCHTQGNISFPSKALLVRTV